MPMLDWIIYHNPRCSKSRETLALLEAAGVKPTIVEYLRDAPSEETLLALLEMLPPGSMVRTKEPTYSGFDPNNKELVARELHLHPELLERPIVVRGNKAVIGRPPENVRELLS
jgi:arsenate reductase